MRICTTGIALALQSCLNRMRLAPRTKLTRLCLGPTQSPRGARNTHRRLTVFNAARIPLTWLGCMLLSARASFAWCIASLCEARMFNENELQVIINALVTHNEYLNKQLSQSESLTVRRMIFEERDLTNKLYSKLNTELQKLLTEGN